MKIVSLFERGATSGMTASETNESRSHSTTFCMRLYALERFTEFQGVADGSYCCENDDEADSTVAPFG
jgi:hypothetical protein